MSTSPGPRRQRPGLADHGPVGADLAEHRIESPVRLHEAGLPRKLRLHDARHGVMTALMKDGIHRAIVSAVLGHASPSFTLSQYGHLLDVMTDQAADTMQRVLGG